MSKLIIPFSLSQLSSEQKERLIQLITEIRADIQYLILIISKNPNAKVVSEVRAILRKDYGWKI